MNIEPVQTKIDVAARFGLGDSACVAWGAASGTSDPYKTVKPSQMFQSVPCRARHRLLSLRL